jgi:hypothetical protein
MSEQAFNPERVASAEQAQAVLDEVNRILAKVPTGTVDVTGRTCSSHKDYGHGNTFLFQYTDGEVSKHDSATLVLATATLRQPDSSEDHYDVLMNPENGLSLAKKVSASPYWKPEQVANRHGEGDDLDRISASLARAFLGLERDKTAWDLEHELGLSQSSFEDANRLLDILKVMPAAPES